MNENLYRVRKALKMTQEEMGRKLGYKGSSGYSLLESGDGAIPEPKLIILKNMGINIHFLKTGEGPIFDTEKIIQKIEEDRIPYYEIPATMSPLVVYNDSQEIPLYYIDMPALKGCDFALPAWGDSMYPKIKNGQIIAVKQLKDKSQIQWGEIYLVITDEIRAVKYLRKHKDESLVILASENRSYDDMIIERDKILNLFIVKGQINILVN